MIRATASDVKNHFGRYLDSALTEPVAITRSGRPVAVMVSSAEYERLVRAWEDEIVARLNEDEASGQLLSVEETEALLDGALATPPTPSIDAAE